jgi:hypothetical protein
LFRERSNKACEEEVEEDEGEEEVEVKDVENESVERGRR